ncbi:MAG: hypothetical protein WD767_15190 [Alphaproteobacteria bacterium]
MGNVLVNGDFRYAQRSMVQPGTQVMFDGPGGFTFDRWWVNQNSDQVDVKQIPGFMGFPHACRLHRKPGSVYEGDCCIMQTIPSDVSMRLAGGQITVPIAARKSTGWTDGDGLMSVSVFYGTGFDEGSQAFGNGSWAGQALAGRARYPLTAAGAQYFPTFDIPSNATEMAVVIDGHFAGTAGPEDWFDVTGIRAIPGIADYAPILNARADLQDCLSYYQRLNRFGNATVIPGALVCADATNAFGVIRLKSPLRTNIGYDVHFSAMDTFHFNHPNALVPSSLSFFGHEDFDKFYLWAMFPDTFDLKSGFAMYLTCNAWPAKAYIDVDADL